jgi:predicted GIY-YIG superfamily endonuclease
MATIYGLKCNDTGELYIGSTKNYEQRKRGHTWKSNTSISKQIINRGNYEFYVIEETDIENRFIRERYYIESNKCINKHIPLRPKNEYIKKYKLENKERLSKQRRELYLKNNRDIEYRIAHREEKLKYLKQYHLDYKKINHTQTQQQSISHYVEPK